MKLVPFIYDDYDDFCANTYLLIDEQNRCVVIDPSKKYDGLKNHIKKNNYQLQAIILTHAHFDHIRGVDILIDEFHVPLYAGAEEISSLSSIYENGSSMFDIPVIVNAKATPLYNGDSLHLIDEDIKVIATHNIDAILKLKLRITLLKESLKLLPNILNIFMNLIASFLVVSRNSIIIYYNHTFFHSVNYLFVMGSHNYCSSYLFIYFF